MEKQLPKNWIEVQLLDILQTLENGSRPKGGVQGILEGIPSLGGEHLNSNGGFKFGNLKYVPEAFAKKMNRGLIKENDILIVKDGATTGKTSFVDKKFPYKVAFVNEHVFISRTFSNINSKAIFYFLISKLGQERILDNFTGSAQGGINQKFASNTLIPLAPLEEQNRIVAKLDMLFTQLENIKVSIERIPVLLKDLKHQILTQAVTGKLTEEWRKGKELKSVEIKTEINSNYFIHPIPKQWKHSIIENIGKVKGGKRLPKGHELVNFNTGFPYIRARDLKQGTVLIDNLMYLTKETHIQIKNYIVRKGDLYITIVGAKIGDAGIIPDQMHGANLTENAAKITDINEPIFNEYLSLWLRGSICQINIQETIMSAAQGKLALTRINQLPIYLPPLEEQQEIVNSVESLFSKADMIEKQYKSLKEKIESLPQILLHKAFTGELTEKLDSDGDAMELLKEIQKLKSQSVKVIKKKINNVPV